MQDTGYKMRDSAPSLSVASSISGSRGRDPGREMSSVLSWCGWSAPLPYSWRPLKIEGTFAKGTMFIGDSGSPYLMVQWWRPQLDGHKSFKPEKWFSYRFKKLHAIPQTNPPKPDCFDHTAWVRDLQSKEEHSRTVWYGYSAAAETVIEIIMTSLTPEDIRNQIVEEIIPSLRVSAIDEQIEWSLFSINFLSPPGFKLDSYHLFSGDVALSLKKGTESLLVRTVYPAKLAVERRSLEQWLDTPPFLDRRKSKDADTSQWAGSSNQRTGLSREGWKRLPAPLGLVKPRYSSAVAAVDHDLDRLLIAEHQRPIAEKSRIAEEAVEQMSRITAT